MDAKHGSLGGALVSLLKRMEWGFERILEDGGESIQLIPDLKWEIDGSKVRF